MRLTARSVVLFALAGVATFAFAVIAAQILDGDADAFDGRVAQRINEWSSPSLDASMIATTYLASLWVIVPAVTLTAFHAWRRGHVRLAYVLLAGWLVAELLNLGLKLMFERPRPDLFREIVAPPTPSRPTATTSSRSSA